jgi:hypothetical protein
MNKVVGLVDWISMNTWLKFTPSRDLYHRYKIWRARRYFNRILKNVSRRSGSWPTYYSTSPYVGSWSTLDFVTVSTISGAVDGSNT